MRILTILTLSLWPLLFILTLGRGVPPPKTIFSFDYQARQLILRKTYLYPNVPLARLFQNKLQVPITKFESNLSALLDPNNYFFGFHPREVVGGLNLVKFPFVSLPFFIFGFLALPRRKNYRLLIFTTLGLIILLSLLENFSGFDFLLYLPLVIVFLWGVKNIPRWFKRFYLPYLFTAVPFAAIEFLRQLIIFLPK